MDISKILLTTLVGLLITSMSFANNSLPLTLSQTADNESSITANVSTYVSASVQHGRETGEAESSEEAGGHGSGHGEEEGGMNIWT